MRDQTDEEGSLEHQASEHLDDIAHEVGIAKSWLNDGASTEPCFELIHHLAYMAESLIKQRDALMLARERQISRLP